MPSSILPGCQKPKIIGDPNNPGARRWSMTRGEDGYRTYTIVHRVHVNITDGPHNALYDTPGLPTPGSIWSFDDDIDEWAFCTQQARVEPVTEGEPNEYFDIEQVFTTKPAVLCPENGNFDDPLMRPDEISGSFVKYTKEASTNRTGTAILNSAWEQMRGPQVEFDDNRPQVRIKQNVADLNFDMLCFCMDKVNDVEMWGFPPRCVKLSGCTWQKHYHVDCTIYYTRELEFDINDETFDRDLIDEGTKVLPGHWDQTTGAYVLDLAAVIKLSCTRTNGNNVLTTTASTTRLRTGMIVQGDGIPDDTTITNIAFGSVTISNNATSDGTGDVKFGREGDPNNPLHFVRFKDRNQENTRVILDGYGRPWDANQVTETTEDDNMGTIHVEYYDETDLQGNLGVPGVFW